MIRMSKDGGYHNFNDHEVNDAIADGWNVVTDAEFADILAAKIPKKIIEKAIDKSVDESDTIESHDLKRRGRPRKEDYVTADR